MVTYSNSKAILYYIHDPMCSWCWGFEPIKQQLFNVLTEKNSEHIMIKSIVGGLAPDTDCPMPQEMQSLLQKTWKTIEHSIAGTQFNFDFWTKCTPRRSTYPSNRAVIAARLQGEHFDELLTLKIQQAYYLQAKNPSDYSTLIQLASELDLNTVQFSHDLTSTKVQQLLVEEIKLSRTLKANGFPALVLKEKNKVTPIQLDYNNVTPMLDQINLAII
jgi:putative protein-disulfide isomerase